MKKSLESKLLPYLFILPTVILMVIFSYYAIVNAVYTSFTDSVYGTTSAFVGIENYIKAFQDKIFLTSFINQLLLTAAAVFNSVFFPLLASELLFFVKHSKAANVIKTLFVVPMMIPTIITIFIWKYLYNPNFGINTILRRIGLKDLAHNWLNDGTTAMLCIILIGFPFVSCMYFLIMHNGLNMVNKELYEAALSDGASPMQVVRFIHIPNLRPYINTVVTLSLINSLSGFGLVAATTSGSPGYSTMIPALYMYKVAFGSGDFGYASACGCVLFIVIIILTLAARKFLGNREEA